MRQIVQAISLPSCWIVEHTLSSLGLVFLATLEQENQRAAIILHVLRDDCTTESYLAAGERLESSDDLFPLNELNYLYSSDPSEPDLAVLYGCKLGRLDAAGYWSAMKIHQIAPVDPSLKVALLAQATDSSTAAKERIVVTRVLMAALIGPAQDIAQRAWSLLMPADTGLVPAHLLPNLITYISPNEKEDNNPFVLETAEEETLPRLRQLEADLAR